MGASLPTKILERVKGYRLINSKLPTIHLFEDVSRQEDFEALYALQELTNPRLNNAVGSLDYLSLDEVPWSIPGTSYAVAPFTHVAPDGSRFSNGDYGVFYIADTKETALSEVSYHWGRYVAGVEDLKFDRIVLRTLAVQFSAELADATVLEMSDPIYDKEDYAGAQALGARLRKNDSEGIQYWSVRNPGATCWGLFTPRHVESVIQAGHYELIISNRQIVDTAELV